MPMTKVSDLGTNINKTKSKDYCKHCYVGGKFTDEMQYNDYVAKQIKLAKEIRGISEPEARKLVHDTLPNLKRWKG